MPLQNRITPFSDIIAHPARGAWMGNRGILHNKGKVLSGRRWTTLGWVICRLSFKGRKRELMTPGRYTELFFLDEATALAAGHRPCYECRRDAALAFRAAWRRAFGGDIPTAVEINRVVHPERKLPAVKRPRVADALSLPDGAFIAQDAQPGEALLKRDGHLWRWKPEGYADPKPAAEAAGTLLTPASTLAVLANGYTAHIHRSAEMGDL